MQEENNTGRQASNTYASVFDEAKTDPKVVNLAFVEPEFDVDPSVRSAAFDAIMDGKNKCSPPKGNPALIDLIRYTTKAETGIIFEDLMITSGASGGMDLCFRAILDKGDEIIIPDPSPASYRQLAVLCGAKPVFTKRDFSDLEEVISPKTKAISINNPSNPTGKVLSETEMGRIIETARKEGLLIISDERYDAFVYKGRFKGIAESYENTLTVKGFSKPYAISGWRIGYALGRKELISTMVKVQQYTYVCPPAPLQAAALTAHRLGPDLRIIDEYKQRRESVYSLLKDHYEVEKPEGAYFMFPKSPSGMSGTEFAAKAADNGLLVVPGIEFSKYDDCFRISYAAEPETLARGIDLLRSFIN